MTMARPENIPGLIERRLGELAEHVKELEFQSKKYEPNYKMAFRMIREVQTSISALSQYPEYATESQRKTAGALMERYRVAVAVFQRNPLEPMQELVT